MPHTPGVPASVHCHPLSQSLVPRQVQSQSRAVRTPERKGCAFLLPSQQVSQAMGLLGLLAKEPGQK